MRNVVKQMQWFLCLNLNKAAWLKARDDCEEYSGENLIFPSKPSLKLKGHSDL